MSYDKDDEIPFVYWDYKEFLLQGKPFVPLIYEGEGQVPLGFNAVLLRLPAGLYDDLDWEKEVHIAEELVQKGYYLLWQLDFGLAAIDLTDGPSFLNLKIAVVEFQKVFARFEKNSLGLLLYSGPLDISANFIWSEKQKEHLQKLFEESSPCDEDQLRRLFCLDSLLNYFSLLAPHISDSLPLFLAFDPVGLSQYEMLELLHKERFEHFLLAIKSENLLIPAFSWQKGNSPFGYIGKDAFIPRQERCLGLIFTEEKKAMENILQKLKGKPLKILYENFATESWDNLDVLIFAQNSSSNRIKRVLRGFQAAGGTIVCTPELEIEGALSLEEFLQKH